MSEERIVYIVIDPSRARSGARSVVGALNGIEGATERVNKRMRATDRAMQGFSRNFGRLQAILITAQPVRFFSAFMRSLVEADKVVTTFKSQLFTVTGDLGQAADEFDRLKDTAQAYAVPINSLTKGFAKLKASMNTPELEKYNDALFQSTVVLSSVLHMAEYNTERVFNVMIQIMSKGQLMMEELKQQLGEHVPGAIALAAESMGMSVREMMDEMQAGNISAEKFASGWSKLILERFGPAVEVATKSIQASINRFNNVIQASMIDLTESEAGFAIARLITTIVEKIDGAGEYFEVFGRRLAEVALDMEDFVKQLQPSDIEDFFEAAINLFKALIDMGGALASAIIFLSTYREEVGLAIKLVGSLWAATKLYTAAIWAFNIAAAASKFRILGMAGAFSILAGAAAGAFAAFAGYSIGTYLYEEFVIVRKFGNRIAMGLTVSMEKVSHAFERAGLRIKLAMSEPFNFIKSQIVDFLQFLDDIGQDVADFFGFDIDTSKLPTALLADALDDRGSKALRQKLLNFEAEAAESIANIRGIYDDLYDSIGEGDDGSTGEALAARLGLPEDFQQRMADMRELLEKMALAEHEAFSGGGSGGASDQLIEDEKALRESLETQEEAILRSYQDTQMEIMRIGKETNMAKEDMRQLEMRNFKDYTIKMLELEIERLEKIEESQKGFWDRYLESMEESLTSGDELMLSMTNKFTSSIGDAVEDMVFEFTTFEDAFKNLMESMLRALINTLGQMAAQWIIYQAVTMLTQKSTAAGAALAKTQEALAAQQMAGLHAFSSTAAIPVVGPPAAPGAMAAAIAATAPSVSAVSGLMAGAAGARAMGGQVQAGSTYLVGERGPELFTAGGTGHVTPNHQMPSSNSTNVTQVFQMSDNARREAKQAVMEAAPFIKQLAKQAIIESSAEGGSMSRVLGRRR